jgi:hypothetical protein
VRANFSAPVQTDPGAHSASFMKGTVKNIIKPMFTIQGLFVVIFCMSSLDTNEERNKAGTVRSSYFSDRRAIINTYSD